MTTKLRYNGYEIAFDDDKKVNLTHMWRACGSNQSHKPYEWLRLPETIRFMDSLEKNSKVGIIPLLERKPGRYGGTFAHWQISNFKQVGPEGYEKLVNAKEKQSRIITTGLDGLLCLKGLLERELRESCPENGV